jgi:hypothetical protein
MVKTGVKPVLRAVVVLMLSLASIFTGVATASAQNVETSGKVAFNNPRSSNPAARRRLGDVVIHAANASKRRDLIRIALYSIDDRRVVGSLIRAYHRGVRVKVLEDHHYNNPQWNRLVKTLGSNPRHRSYARHCVGSCRGTGQNTTLHSKIYLFSRGQTVMVGSSNMTANGFQNQYNDLFVTHNRTLYAKMGGLFASLAADKPNAYREFGTSGFLVQAYPRTVSRSNDPEMTILKGIRCKGAAKGYGYHRRTVVRINMHGWTGTRGRYLAREVRYKYRHGCNMRIIGGDSIGSVVKHILRHVPHQWARDDRPYSHLKVMTVSGRYGHDRSAKLVWTGSQNWADGINRRDEVVIRINIPSVVYAYNIQFARMWGVYRT